MLTGRHRTRRHQALRIMAVSVATLLGLLAFGAFRGGSGVAASTLRTIDPASLSSLPLCDGSPVRHEAVAQEEHEVTGTTLDEASSVIQFTYNMPTRVPDWVSCQVVEHVEWSDTEAQAGGVTLWLYADSYGKAPAMEVFVAPPPLKPRPLDAPLDGWDSVPIKDRQGWFQFVLPPEAPSLWTEIAWFDSDGTYYRLRGSFPLDVALEIANSISPEESRQVG